MEKKQIRTPQQQRSIEKRNKIIDAGYQLFCEKGFHHTNTAEIAKFAGVSTGIVYSYFHDKKDIFLEVIKRYENNITSPIYETIQNLKLPLDLTRVIKEIIIKLAKSHTLNKTVHEEMLALAHTDPEIGELYNRSQANIAANLVELLNRFDIHPSHAYEKAYLICIIVENLTHEMMYHQQENVDYNVMVDVTVKAIMDMLTN